MIKVLAIGNSLMKDDKIGLLVGKVIEKELKELGASLYICETDIEFALSNIGEKDFIIIIDAMYSGNNSPAEIQIFPIKNKETISIYTQHSLNLIQLINLYYKETSGYVIGIEAEDISYGLNISDKLSLSFNKICCQVLKLIKIAAYNI